MSGAVEENMDEAVVPYTPTAQTSIDESSVKVIPNPVYSDATIVFNASQECEAEIEIFSSDLKMVHALTVDATKGSNTYLINGSDIEAGGVYYYRVRQGDRVFTGKFVKLQ